jgi:hypothetical protein
MWENLVEWNNFNGQNDSMFNSMGLISDGQGPGEDPEMFGKPRLSYYAYKLMVEKLEVSDWKSIETIQESNDVYIYKFRKNGKPIWVLWNDNTEAKSVSLNVGDIQSVKITESIPKYESGSEVTDYSTALNMGSGKISKGYLTINLGQSPVYLEESGSSLSEYSPTIFLQSSNELNIPQNPKGKCGDSICGESETSVSCAFDCKSTIPPVQIRCPDGVCGPVEREKGTCPEDCG